jgi:hypothetical protein
LLQVDIFSVIAIAVNGCIFCVQQLLQIDIFSVIAIAVNGCIYCV